MFPPLPGLFLPVTSFQNGIVPFVFLNPYFPPNFPSNILGTAVKQPLITTCLHLFSVPLQLRLGILLFEGQGQNTTTATLICRCVAFEMSNKSRNLLDSLPDFQFAIRYIHLLLLLWQNFFRGIISNAF